MEVYNHDLVILGTGLAGLRAALEAAQQSKGELNIALVSKLQLMRAHSVAAEGGTAAVVRQDEGDSYELHAWDTVKGSDFLADQDVVDFFVHEMPKEILHLDHWGIPWSRREDGRIAQRPFGGHTFPRAVFAADKTGHLEMQTLYDTLMKHTRRIHRYDEGFVTSILIQNNRFAGLTMIDMINGRFVLIRGKALILATGGAGQIFGFTTYSETVTGDGLAMAYRAGLPLKDMEFIQFHPTALSIEGAPRFLLSEAMRGEGGVLRNLQGERFMSRYDERLELAPRDIVSRSIVAEMRRTGSRYVNLDMTALDAEFLRERFPKIDATCRQFGLDIAKDMLPVSPASHYCMGGIRTDLHGRSSVPGLYAAGEVTCTGVHGANRLASNSLLEGLVFGARAGEAAAADSGRLSVIDRPSANDASGRPQTAIATAVKKRVKRVMWERVGILRDRESLQRAISEFEQIEQASLSTSSRNFVTLALLVARAALWREESRGGHYRSDFPDQREDFRVHSIQTLGSEITSSEQIDFPASADATV